jgi:N-terminal half of MaoC dehydratase
MSYEVQIELGKVREFARAIHSRQEDYFRSDGVIPPTFLTTARLFWEPESERSAIQHGFDPRRVLHGEEEFVFYGSPPKIGQALTATLRQGDRYEKQSRSGGMMRFAVTVTEYRDKEGTLVAEQRTTVIETPKAEGAEK